MQAYLADWKEQVEEKFLLKILPAPTEIWREIGDDVNSIQLPLILDINMEMHA